MSAVIIVNRLGTVQQRAGSYSVCLCTWVADTEQWVVIRLGWRGHLYNNDDLQQHAYKSQVGCQQACHTGDARLLNMFRWFIYACSAGACVCACGLLGAGPPNQLP